MLTGIGSGYGISAYSAYQNTADRVHNNKESASAADVALEKNNNLAAPSALGNEYRTGIEVPALQLAQSNAIRPQRGDVQYQPDAEKGTLGIDAEKTQGAAKDEAIGKECQTCAKRRYQDQSNDPGVSFKSPTQVSPQAAHAAVVGHEMQHVTRERVQAEQEGREIVSQSVTLKTAICPECGKAYIAGGETVTTTREAPENNQQKLDGGDEAGKFLDMRV